MLAMHGRPTEAADHSHDGLPPGHRHPHGRPGQGEDPTAPPSIGIVGAGRVGLALGRALRRPPAGRSSAVASRDAGRREAFRAAVPGRRAFAEPSGVLDEASLIFLTVPDDAIAAWRRTCACTAARRWCTPAALLASTVLEPAMAAGTETASFHPLVAFADPERAVAALPGATVALEGDEPLVRLLG